MKRRIICLLLLSLILTLLLPVTSVPAQEPAVYVRKHVSILYDNSGSMKSWSTHGNLRWCYASYAAQMFAGLLNDTDTLDITFMKGDSLTDLDLTASRQTVLDAILSRTAEATAPTPLSKVDTALQYLVTDGLKKGQGANPPGEQYWLVLTTDGQFQDDNEQNKTDKDVVDKLCAIMTDYPDLHLVYFGIGSAGASGSNDAKDFRESSANIDDALLRQLHSHDYFTAVYAASQEEIISTMRSLSNQISGRYTVPNQSEMSDNVLQLHLSAEGSPIRNIAVMAQETNAHLLSVTAEDGTELSVSRDGQVRYPHNSNYANIPDGTLGGYVALITDPSGRKLPNGTVTLTFSEPVAQENLVLMYEPAIYLHLDVERSTGNGQWEPLSETDKLLEGDQIRVNYDICEDGTGRVLDPTKLFGETFFQCLFNGEEFSKEDVITVSQGDITLEVRASMMNGGYTINVVRNYQVSHPGLEDYVIQSTGPVELRRKDVAENTEKYIEFSVLLRDQPAPEDFTSKLSVKVDGKNGKLDGAVDKPASHILRFTPKDADCLAGDYTVSLFYEGASLLDEHITVLPNETTYSAVAGESISIMSNHVADNTDSVSFTVTAHRDQGEGPITVQEQPLFTVRAGSGAELKGRTEWAEDGTLLFTLQDPAAVPGTYPVSLWLEDQKLAETSLTVIHYDAAFTVQTIVPSPAEVDRFALEDNQTAVSFLILQDGAPCTAEQLEAMLGREIRITTDLNSSYAEMDIRVATVDGKPVIVCTPVSTTDSSILLFFSKLLISTGLTGLNASEIHVELQVDMPKGDAGSGTLDLVGLGTVYLLSLIIILVVILLVFLFFFMNARSRRLKKGSIWSFSLNADSYGRYSAAKISSTKIGSGWHFVLFAPKHEKHRVSCAGAHVTFRAEPQKTKGGSNIGAPRRKQSFFGWSRQNPMVYVEASDTQNYHYCDLKDGESSKFARNFLNGIKSGTVFSLEDADGNSMDPQGVLFAGSQAFQRQKSEDGTSSASQTSSVDTSAEASAYSSGITRVSGQIKNDLGMVYWKETDKSGHPNYTVVVYDAYRETARTRKNGMRKPSRKAKKSNSSSGYKAPRK